MRRSGLRNGAARTVAFSNYTVRSAKTRALAVKHIVDLVSCLPRMTVFKFALEALDPRVPSSPLRIIVIGRMFRFRIGPEIFAFRPDSLQISPFACPAAPAA